MFYDKYKSLCDQKGISCAKAAAEMGLSNSVTTKWKLNGIVPDGTTLRKIADYFSVPIDFLLDRKISVLALHQMFSIDLRLFSENYPNAPFNINDQKENILQFFDDQPIDIQEKLEDDIDGILENALTLSDERAKNLVKSVFEPYVQEIKEKSAPPKTGDALTVEQSLLLDMVNSLSDADVALLLRTAEGLIALHKAQDGSK